MCKLAADAVAAAAGIQPRAAQLSLQEARSEVKWGSAGGQKVRTGGKKLQQKGCKLAGHMRRNKKA